MRNEKKFGSGGIRTHASEETGALNQRLRPLGHATCLPLTLILLLKKKPSITMRFTVSFPGCPYQSLWRNRLARSTVNRKVGGSSPPRDGSFFRPTPLLFSWWTYSPFCYFSFVSHFIITILRLSTQKRKKGKNWARRDSNTQPSDLESDALPLRHRPSIPTLGKPTKCLQHPGFPGGHPSKY